MRRNFTHDDALEMKDAGLVAASAAAQVDSAAKVLDLGEGFVRGEILIDVSALEIASNDEIYDIVLQLTNTAAFATATDIVDRVSLTLSAAEVKRTDSNCDSAVDRYTIPFNNEYAGTIYRYARLYTVVGGTIATGINYTGWMTKGIAA
jgi:hypothetical protein